MSRDDQQPTDELNEIVYNAESGDLLELEIAGNSRDYTCAFHVSENTSTDGTIHELGRNYLAVAIQYDESDIEWEFPYPHGQITSTPEHDDDSFSRPKLIMDTPIADNDGALVVDGGTSPININHMEKIND